MSTKRKRFSAKFRASAVLQVLSGDKEPAALCQEHGLSPELLEQWKNQFIKNARMVFVMVDDAVRNHCLKMGYADHVVLLGLEGQVMRWHDHVQRLIAGDDNYHSAHCDYYVYLNDMDGRRVLEECLAVASSERRQRFLPLVKAADEQFMAITVPTDECIWGKKNAEKRSYNAEEHWWYYRRPKGSEADWQSLP